MLNKESFQYFTLSPCCGLHFFKWSLPNWGIFLLVCKNKIIVDWCRILFKIPLFQAVESIICSFSFCPLSNGELHTLLFIKLNTLCIVDVNPTWSWNPIIFIQGRPKVGFRLWVLKTVLIFPLHFFIYWF